MNEYYFFLSIIKRFNILRDLIYHKCILARWLDYNDSQSVC